MEEVLKFTDGERFSDLLNDEKLSENEYLEMYEVVGAALEVYNELGRGMEEAIYQEALEMELRAESIQAESQVALRTWYKGTLMNKVYYADFVANGDIIVELKSVARIIPEHRSQLFNYMRVTRHRRGILLNFGDSSFYAERYLYLPSVDDFVLLRKENLQYFVTRNRDTILQSNPKEITYNI